MLPNAQALSADWPRCSLHTSAKYRQYIDDVVFFFFVQKLVEVAEMHGELMEFNERLHVRLQSALSLLHNMKTELVDLRGPVNMHDKQNTLAIFKLKFG